MAVEVFRRPARGIIIPRDFGASGQSPIAAAFRNSAIGGGGFFTSLDVAADGTMVTTVDVYGAYLASTALMSTPWTQLVTMDSMPGSLVGVNSNHSTRNQGGLGGYSIRIAPTNTSIFYMLNAGVMLFSSNKGTLWTLMANFPAITWAQDANGASRLTQKKMAIDPANADIVFIGTPANGLYKTLNGTSGASATFTSVTGVPSAGAQATGVRGIVFDPATVSGGITQTLYAATDAGVYASTNAGVSWTLLSGSPTSVQDAIVVSGALYCATLAGISKYTGGLAGSWSTIYTDPGGVSALAINPFNLSWMGALANGGGYFNQTVNLNAGNTFNGPYFFEGGNANTPPSDVGWIADTRPGDGSGNVFPSNNNWSGVSLWFDPITANRVWMSWGYGVSYFDLPNGTFGTNTPMAWNTKVAGTNAMVSRGIVSQVGYAPILAVEDEQVFRITNPRSYPVGSGLVVPAYGLGNRQKNCASWSMDGSLSVNGVITVLSTGYYVGTAANYSSYSTDGGQTWILFPVLPFINDGGCITCTDANHHLTVSAVYIANITGGTYNSSTGAVSLTLDRPVRFDATEMAAASQQPNVSGLTGTGANLGSLDGDFTLTGASGSTVTYTAATGLGSITITGGALVSKFVYPLRTADGGNTWVRAVGLPTGAYIGANSAKFNPTQIMTNDANGWMYVYLGSAGVNGTNGGTYRSKDGGVTWTKISSQDLTLPEFFGCIMKAVPGQPGKLFFCLGDSQLGMTFYTATDSGGGVGSMTWTAVSNVEDVFCFGFGAIAPGFTAPTLWLLGFVNVGGSGFKYGVWRSRDLGVSDWTYYTDYPARNADTPVCISGDMNDPTKCYIGYTGTTLIDGSGL